ncbi:MAG TPA: FlgD immunoglobulin-like domain containing protein [Thermoanaerobaculia bacterium]
MGGPANFVRVTPATFNPTAGQNVVVAVHAASDARLFVHVLDRDGYAVRALADDQPVAAGTHLVPWDGRDSTGEVVADEAYSFRVVLETREGILTYLPAAQPAKTSIVSADQYSRRNGALMYELAAPSRVHAQAGSAALNGKTKTYDGPVLKTLVNREPRPAGRIVESWNGLDETGALYVPDVPNFVTAILATELPENSVIAYGNTGHKFVDVVAKRTGVSLLPHSHTPAQHHAGLTTLEDVSPTLTITPTNARWDTERKAWVVRGRAAEMSVELTGPTAAAVARQPGRIVVFVDFARQFEVRVRSTRERIRLRTDGMTGSGPRLVTVNWQSDRGPLATNSVRMLAERSVGTEAGHAPN